MNITGQEMSAPPSISLALMIWKISVKGAYGDPDSRWPESLRSEPLPRREAGIWTHATNDYYFRIDLLNAGSPAVVWVEDTGPNP